MKYISLMFLFMLGCVGAAAIGFYTDQFLVGVTLAFFVGYNVAALGIPE